jgi:hypothetical protein
MLFLLDKPVNTFLTAVNGFNNVFHTFTENPAACILFTSLVVKASNKLLIT